MEEAARANNDSAGAENAMEASRTLPRVKEDEKNKIDIRKNKIDIR